MMPLLIKNIKTEGQKVETTNLKVSKTFRRRNIFRMNYLVVNNKELL